LKKKKNRVKDGHGAQPRGKDEGMVEKGSRDTKQDGHDFNRRTGLVVWKVVYIPNLTIIRSTPHRNSFSRKPSQDADWSHLQHQQVEEQWIWFHQARQW
jgi:hypothetical protein